MTKFNASARSQIPEYIFATLLREMKQLEQERGRDVLNLIPGSPDFQPSVKLTKKLKTLVSDSDAHIYPGYKGIPEFNSALTNWYHSRFGVNLQDQEILPLLGAKDGVTHIPLALTDPGDEILVPNPGYPAYSGSAAMLGVIPISYDLADFNSTLNSLESKITKKTKFIWVNYPNNPTGKVITKSALKQLVDLALTHHIPIVYDNAYSEITFDGYVAPSILEIQGSKDIAVEIGSFSKSFSLAGFRMGWIVGNSKIIKTLATVKSQFDTGLSLPLQRLGAFALNNPDSEWHKQMLESYKHRRDIISDKLRGLGLQFEVPQGALYIWAKIPPYSASSIDFCRDLLHEKMVALTPGTAFGSGGEGFIRASICINIKNIEEYL